MASLLILNGCQVYETLVVMRSLLRELCFVYLYSRIELNARENQRKTIFVRIFAQKSGRGISHGIAAESSEIPKTRSRQLICHAIADGSMC